MRLILPMILPVIAALAIWLLPKGKRALENAYMLAALVVSALFALLCTFGGEESLTLWQLTDKIAIALKTDGLARFYLVFISIVWVMVGIYSTAYNAHDAHARRFNCFYLATYGI